MLIYFYNGSRKSPSNKLDTVVKLHSAREPIDLIINHKFHTFTVENNDKQVTDFRDIFKNVQEIISQIVPQSKLDCITFLSDFYHEPERDLEERDFKNEYYTGYGDFLEFKEIITLKPPKNINDENDSLIISFFSPISNSLKYDEAQVKIILDKTFKTKLDTTEKDTNSIIGKDINSIIMKNTDSIRTSGMTKKDTVKFRWKIKSISDNNNTFITFRKNCKENDIQRCIFNQWYEDECDSLWLSIKMKPDYDCNIDDLRFCYVVEDNGVIKFFEKDIKLKKIFFSDKYKRILTCVLNGFCILLFISLVAGEVLFIHEFLRYERIRSRLSISTRKCKDISWISGMILLIAFLSFIVIFIWP